jgi:hypothetical protein
LKPTKDHVRPTVPDAVTAALFLSKLGGSGKVIRTAPLPGYDALELPTAFV